MNNPVTIIGVAVVAISGLVAVAKILANALARRKDGNGKDVITRSGDLPESQWIINIKEACAEAIVSKLDLPIEIIKGAVTRLEASQVELGKALTASVKELANAQTASAEKMASAMTRLADAITRSKGMISGD